MLAFMHFHILAHLDCFAGTKARLAKENGRELGETYIIHLQHRALLSLSVKSQVMQTHIGMKLFFLQEQVPLF